MAENFKHKVAQKMMGKARKYISKAYTSTRCGQCGKFGHHHSSHSGESVKDMGGNPGYASDSRVQRARARLPEIQQGLEKFAKFAKTLKKPSGY